MITNMGAAAAKAARATLLTSPILDTLTATDANARGAGATIMAALPDTDTVEQGHADADHEEREAEQERAPGIASDRKRRARPPQSGSVER